MPHTTRAPAPPQFTAAFTDAQVESIESRYNETWGVNRRLMMIALARSGPELIDGFGSMTGDGADALLSMAEQVIEYRDHLRNGIELAESAIARLLSVAEYLAAGGRRHV